MEFINVFDIGKKHAAWKYFAKSCAVLSLQMTTLTNWGEVLFLLLLLLAILIMYFFLLGYMNLP